MHVENHVKPQNGKCRGKGCECAAMDACHRLRGIAIDLPDDVWACSVSPERVEMFAKRGVQHAVSINLFMSHRNQK